LTVNLVFGTAKNRLSISINRLFRGVVLRHPSLDSVDDFCGNFRLRRRNYNINIARRMDMIRIYNQLNPSVLDDLSNLMPMILAVSKKV
jgi:hypothetical protein